MASNFQISALIDCYGKMLSAKQRSIIEQYYNEDLSLSEIADNEGMSRQGVSDYIHRTENCLKNYENNLEFLKISNIIKQKANKTEVGNQQSVRDLIETINKLF